MNKKIWDLYAPIYERAMRADRKVYQYMYDRIPQIIADKEVLEIATGPGLLAKNVADAAKKMIATDYSEGMIAEAKKGVYPSNLIFEVADATALPYKDDSFDVVLIANAFHVMPEPEKALSEIDRVLKSNGILIAPNFVAHKGTFISRVWSKILQIAGISFEHQWSAAGYQDFLKQNGWETLHSREMQARIAIVYTECVRKGDILMGNRIKANLSDTAETMLQSFYARAQYSLSPKHKFYDAKAVEIVQKIDYDFSHAEKDRTMSGGVLARTIVFDEQVKDFIAQNPDCTVVNIACGLDTRVYRVDNGKLRWYNLDLPEVIELRNQLFGEAGRISTIGISALDSSWANKVEIQGAVLFIIEGLTMYLTAEEVGTLLGIIRDNFVRATVMMECISPVWVAKQGVEKSIAKTGAKFKWGANSFDELGSIGNGFHKVKDDNILRGMAAIQPIYHIFSKLPLAKKITQKILVFERDEV